MPDKVKKPKQKPKQTSPKASAQAKSSPGGPVSIKCPACGQTVSARNEDELVTVFRQHSKELDWEDISLAQAEKTVKQALAKQAAPKKAPAKKH